MIIYPLRSASRLELILSNDHVSPEDGLFSNEDLVYMATLGCPFAIALLSGWKISSCTKITNEYGSTRGNGKRIYLSDIEMRLPTDLGTEFSFTFHAKFIVNFADRDATLSVAKFRFCGEPYKFADHHEFVPSVHDYMFAIGASSSYLNRLINDDEVILPIVRHAWLKKYAPSRVHSE
jgi:hypothetical protein